ncbi:MAG: hypothetical protein GSR75_01205 [Desulfurococcales archaeon]|nr:hypothetical protein [Desulfurococcales archaeon]
MVNMNRGLTISILILVGLSIITLSIYYIHNEQHSQQYFHCSDRGSFLIKGKDPVALVDSYLVLEDQFGRISVLDLKANRTVNVSFNSSANPDIWGFVDYNGSILVGVCKPGSIDFVDLFTGRAIHKLVGLYSSVDQCIGAHPIWAGENYYAFYGPSSLLNIDPVDSLLTGEGKDVATASFKLVETHRGKEVDLSGVLVSNGTVYTVYGSAFDSLLYIKAYSLQGNKLLYTDQLKMPGNITYAGFIYREGSKPLLWVLYYTNGEDSLTYYLAVYKLVRGSSSLVCRTELNNTLIVYPLSENFRDIDGDGAPDIILALTNQLEGTPNTEEVNIKWLELKG